MNSNDSIKGLVEAAQGVLAPNGKKTKDFADLHTVQKRAPQFESTDEANAFVGAAAKAKAEGKKQFEFSGKTYPVEIAKEVANTILKSKKEDTDDNTNDAIKANLKDLKKSLPAKQTKQDDYSSLEESILESVAYDSQFLEDLLEKLKFDIDQAEDLNEERSASDYDALIKKHMAALKGKSGEDAKHHKDMIIKYRRAKIKASAGGSAPKASGEDPKEVERKRLASIKKALANPPIRRESEDKKKLDEFDHVGSLLDKPGGNKPDRVKDSFGELSLFYRSSADMRAAAQELEDKGIDTRRGSDKGTLEVDSNSKYFKDKGITRPNDSGKRKMAVMRILSDSVEYASEETLEEKKSLDPVNKKAVAKDFDDRKDKDIDNDGDVDSSDEYLHKRRKAISKAVKKEASEKDFKPHMMYDPKTGKGYKADTHADHLKYKKMGYVHDKPEVKKEYVGPALTPANQIAKKYGGKVKAINVKDDKGKKTKMFYAEDESVDESTAEYAKSLEKIANDRKMKSISKKDRVTLSKIAELLKRANEDVGKETVEEAVDPRRFVLGGKTKTTKADVDKIIGKLFLDNSLLKKLENSKAFQAGEKSKGKKKNPYKVDTADYHHFELGIQSSQVS